jgi:formyl-CoA transferase
MYAYSGILTALNQRATTGRIAAVEVSLFEALAEWLAAPAYYTRYGGSQPDRVGAQHATIVPYGPFTTADDETILLAIQNEREWHTFCQIALDQPDLAGDHRFATNTARVNHRDELNALIATRFATLDTATVLTLLDSANVANARLNSLTQFLDHPVLADRWRTVGTPGGDIEALLPPATLTGTEPAMNPVPALGEHTDAILRGLGRTNADIATLRAARVI